MSSCKRFYFWGLHSAVSAPLLSAPSHLSGILMGASCSGQPWRWALGFWGLCYSDPASCGAAVTAAQAAVTPVVLGLGRDWCWSSTKAEFPHPGSCQGACPWSCAPSPLSSFSLCLSHLPVVSAFSATLIHDFSGILLSLPIPSGMSKMTNKAKEVLPGPHQVPSGEVAVVPGDQGHVLVRWPNSGSGQDGGDTCRDTWLFSLLLPSPGCTLAWVSCKGFFRAPPLPWEHPAPCREAEEPSASPEEGPRALQGVPWRGQQVPKRLEEVHDS